jgi:RHS repeat-associated protein
VYELRCSCGQLLSERSSSGTNYVLFDALGSTIGLTDGSGGLVASWTYDPWGNVLAKTGTATTPVLFQGSYLDQSTGLYKMGMRYYDPNIARWTQLDPVFGNLAQPDTLNRYAFVRNNPVNLEDPTGAFWCGFVCGVVTLAYCFVLAEVPILLIICTILWIIVCAWLCG